MGKRHLLLFFVLLAVGTSIAYLESRKPKKTALPAAEIVSSPGLDTAAQERAGRKEKKFPRAKELIAPDGYINTQPFDLRGLVGKKVVLLDFWTYSCINCQRTLPYLKAWYEKYKDAGLEIVGVHSPEFAFEKEYDNVLAAVKKARVPYPVILDNDHQNFRLYETSYWPTKVLVDIDGFIVYRHIGEGDYGQTESKILELLKERKAVLGEAAFDKKEVVPEGVVEVDFWKIGTPEIYLGSRMSRGNFGNPEGLSFGKTIDYRLPAELRPNEIYIQGSWHNAEDHLELKGATGKIVLIYRARVVNIVAGAMGPEVRMKVKVDGRSVTAGKRGKDTDPQGEARVGPFDLYNVIADSEYGTHKLELEIEGAGLAAYAFTFG